MISSRGLPVEGRIGEGCEGEGRKTRSLRSGQTIAHTDITVVGPSSANLSQPPLPDVARWEGGG